MTYTYNSVAAIQKSQSLRERLTACAAIEKYGDNNPWGWVDLRMWRFAAMPEWGDQWTYAVDRHKDDTDPYDPGRQEDVITDAQILSAVQAVRQDDLADERARAMPPVTQPPADPESAY